MIRRLVSGSAALGGPVEFSSVARIRRRSAPWRLSWLGSGGELSLPLPRRARGSPCRRWAGASADSLCTMWWCRGGGLVGAAMACALGSASPGRHLRGSRGREGTMRVWEPWHCLPKSLSLAHLVVHSLPRGTPRTPGANVCSFRIRRVKEGGTVGRFNTWGRRPAQGYFGLDTSHPAVVY